LKSNSLCLSCTKYTLQIIITPWFGTNHRYLNTRKSSFPPSSTKTRYHYITSSKITWQFIPCADCLHPPYLREDRKLQTPPHWQSPCRARCRILHCSTRILHMLLLSSSTWIIKADVSEVAETLSCI
jgi:hypothetical protein